MNIKLISFVLLTILLSCGKKNIENSLVENHYEVILNNKVLLNTINEYIEFVQKTYPVFLEKDIITISINKTFFQTEFYISYLPKKVRYDESPSFYTFINGNITFLYSDFEPFIVKERIINEIIRRDSSIIFVITSDIYYEPDYVKLTMCNFDSSKYYVDCYRVELPKPDISDENCKCYYPTDTTFECK
ncbi:MAG: hypothetical protein A2033_01815 [Bacteroidetes bacterium GWA2_31_9]|nr:MAG: hypothetical protein A2033_01815 [Bacteroidetes bacterium GWA2_31_9]